MGVIERYSVGKNIVANVASSNTPGNGFAIGSFASGGFAILTGADSNNTINTITWYVSADGITYFPCYDATLATAVLQEQGTSTGLTNGYGYAIPASVFNWPYAQAVGHAAGTIQLALKS